MKLTDIAKATKEAGKPQNLFNLLIYGDPKTGKSRLAATISKLDFIRTVHFFTVENGLDTLLTAYREGILSESHAEKVIVYNIPDTADSPHAFGTISKITTANRDWKICELHGRCDCTACATYAESKVAGATAKKIIGYTGQEFNLAKCTPSDVVIIDNLTQVSRSTIAWSRNSHGKGKSIHDIESRYQQKDGWDEYGDQGRVLSDILSVIQACSNTNFICTAHRLGIDFTATGQRANADESATDDSVITKYYPAIGTKNFSLLAGGFFTHIIYVEKRLNQHKGGSSTQYNPDILTGSRGGWKIEDQKSLDLSPLFDKLVNVVPTSTNVTPIKP